MRPPAPVVLLLALVAAALVLLATARPGGRRSASAVRASWTLTPGVLNPDVTQANIGATVCAHGWTKTIRPPVAYTNRLKLEQMRQYGVGGDPSDYQEDHLVSLELGGHPTDPRNLWPEPRPRAEEVDATENELNDRVCEGSLSLADAQRRISKIKHEDG
jgi:hypothetical protein